MRSFAAIREAYRLNEVELETLKGLVPVLESHLDEILSDFYRHFETLPDTAGFLADEERRHRLQENHKKWLMGVLRGPYDDSYFRRLQRIGYTHMRIGLSAHFVYVGMNFLRQRFQAIVATEVEAGEREAARAALDKALDLNLDVIARTYHEEELRRVALTHVLDEFLIRFAKRFTLGLDFLLVVGLILLAAGTVVMLVADLSLVFRTSPEKGMVATLGSLLILWLMIELLEAQIERVKGGEFKLSLFVGVALIAFIRKVLVATVAQESLAVESFYLGGILVLGFIFWLVARTERIGK